MNRHFGSRAGLVAALDADDPERLAAEVHASECEPCRDALEEGRRLVRLLAQALPLPEPTPEALRLAARVVEVEIARENRSRRALTWATAVAVALAWGLQIALGYWRVPSDFHRVVVSLGVLAVAIGGVAFTRGRRRFAIGALIATSGLLAFGAGAIPALEPKIGAACTAYELLAAAIPWTVAAVLARRSGGLLRRADMMAFAAGGALASQAAQHLTCPVFHADAHLLIFHLGGVTLAVLLGGLAHRALPPGPPVPAG